MSENNSKSFNKTGLIFGLSAFLIFALTCLAFFLIMSGFSFFGTNAVEINSEKGKISESKFLELTKEDAVKFLETGDKYKNGIMPDNYVGAELENSIVIKGGSIKSDLDLEYSHGSESELTELINDKYSSFDLYTLKKAEYTGELNIKDYDYYKIVTPKKAENSDSCDGGYNRDCDSFLSFKSEFLDYQQVETARGSYNDIPYLKTRDPKIASFLMRTYSYFTKVGMGSAHGNIYGYDFEDAEDKYVLTIFYVGAGVNMELYEKTNATMSRDEMMGINLYRRRLVANKKTDVVDFEKTNIGTTTYLKSFPITMDEYNALPGYGG